MPEHIETDVIEKRKLSIKKRRMPNLIDLMLAFTLNQVLV